MWAWKKLTKSRRNKRKKKLSPSSSSSSTIPTSQHCCSPIPTCSCACNISHHHTTCCNHVVVPNCAHIPQGNNEPCNATAQTASFYCCTHQHASYSIYPSPLLPTSQPTAPPLPPDAEYQPLLGDSKSAVSQGTSSFGGEFDIDPVGYGSFQNTPQSARPSGSYQQYIVPTQSREGTTTFGVPVMTELPPKWTTGLFDCSADPSICLLGCLCPCVLLGKNAEWLDDGMTTCASATVVWYLLQQFTTCGWVYSWGYRKKLRSKYGMPQRPLLDLFVHFFCWSCAFCQENRELHIRRLRNDATWSTGGGMVAPPQQIMQC